MKNQLIKNLLTILAGAVYVLLFNQQEMGLNSLIFMALLTAYLLYTQPDTFNNKSVRLVLFGTLLSVIMVVVHNSELSKVIYSLSFICLVGMLQVRTLRFMWYAFVLGLFSILSAPITWFRSWYDQSEVNWNRLLKWIQILAFPVVVLPVFLAIYAAAVPSFENFLDHILVSASTWLDFNISIPGLRYFIMGICVSAAFLFPGIFTSKIQAFDSRQSFDIQRKKNRFISRFLSLGLRKEYYTSLMTIGSLNVLLFLVNGFHVFDLVNATQYVNANQLSNEVHEATEMLIFSIVIVMAILLVFFRKNLNFYPNNKPLKIMAKAWLLQNLFLVLVTAAHDFRYVQHYGLTDYRLFVFLFLFLTAAGLFTFYLKIQFQKSNFFVIALNSWIIYLTFLACTTVNWDGTIARYNMEYARTEQIDWQFLSLRISSSSLPYFLRNEDRLSKAYPHEKDQLFRVIDQKVEDFKAKQNGRSWKSWNWRAAKIERLIKKRE